MTEQKADRTFETDVEIRKAAAEAARYYLVDRSTRARGAGRLEVSIEPSGVKLWKFRTYEAGRRIRIPLGAYGSAPGQLTLAEARKRAGKLSGQVLAGETVKPAAPNGAHTLRKLCEFYVERLEAQGAQSVRDVRSLFKNHVYTTVHADRPAVAITTEDVTSILRTVVAAGYGRTAAKVRSYLRSAYAHGKGAKGNAQAPAALVEFGITANPVSDTDPLHEFNKTKDRTLSTAELGEYLRRVRALDSTARTPLLVHALVAGQRPRQLLRVTLADVDLEHATLTQWDPKGRRQQARKHVLPLTGEALKIVRALVAEREKAGAVGTDLLFVTHGKPVDSGTLSNAVADISADMVAAKVSRDRFTLSAIRSAATTIMTVLKIPGEVRDHLQSHGLGGVVNRHYQHHDFIPEMKAALGTWTRALARYQRPERKKK